MVPFRASIVAISVIHQGLYSQCSHRIAHKDWKAPACLQHGVIATVDAVFSELHHAKARKKVKVGKNPDKKERDLEDFAMGHLLLHQGDHSTPSVNMTRDLYEKLQFGVPYNVTNSEHGMFQHVITWKDEYTTSVRTDMKSGLASCDKGCPKPDRSLEKRLSRYDNTYNHLHIEAKARNKNHHHLPQKSARKFIGRRYANQMWRLGNYCSHVSTKGNRKFVHLALTADGKGLTSGNFTPRICGSNGARVEQNSTWTFEG